jgi:hypothetical protein
MGVKGDGGGRVTPFLEVGDVEKKGPRRGGGPAGDTAKAQQRRARAGDNGITRSVAIRTGEGGG